MGASSDGVGIQVLFCLMPCLTGILICYHLGCGNTLIQCGILVLSYVVHLIGQSLMCCFISHTQECISEWRNKSLFIAYGQAISKKGGLSCLLSRVDIKNDRVGLSLEFHRLVVVFRDSVKLHSVWIWSFRQ